MGDDTERRRILLNSEITGYAAAWIVSKGTQSVTKEEIELWIEDSGVLTHLRNSVFLNDVVIPALQNKGINVEV